MNSNLRQPTLSTQDSDASEAVLERDLSPRLRNMCVITPEDRNNIDASEIFGNARDARLEADRKRYELKSDTGKAKDASSDEA